jgi:iron-sulfur cluster protein
MREGVKFKNMNPPYRPLRTKGGRRKIDPSLKTVLQNFSRSYLGKRQNVLQGYDFEALRTELAELKDRALEQNEQLLARFEQKARAHGSHVLHARDGAEANRMILKICRDHGVLKMVKSKSMVSEETGLNDFLAEHGVEAGETDLGEWIVQLGAEKPTHMVMPAIHLTRHDVAALFSEKTGQKVPAEITALVRIARQEMRQEVFAAQAGLTGANALIAENGAVMVVTNEGNGRLVSTIPALHIVLASIEKLLPRVEDALLLLKLLPRNATGQTITSYVSFIAGPHKGPQYIILLDNHRSEILADPRFRDVLRCIKCSACLNVCPVYQIIGGDEFSHIYMGGIGALLTAWIHGLKASKRLAKVCLRCHRCEAYCATKIGIADLITALAERINTETGKPLWKRLAFDGVMARPKVQKAAFGTARKVRRLIGKKNGFSRKLPAWIKKYDRFRSLPAPARKPFSSVFKTSFVPEISENKQKKGMVTLFAGCLVEHFYPEIGMAAARVLARLGYEVKPGPALCCGFPPSNAGFRRASGKAFAKLLERIDAQVPIITLCPTCTTMLAKTGPEAKESVKAKDLATRVNTFSQFIFLNELESLSALMSARRKIRTVAYHDSCHHKNVLKASQASRKLIEKAIKSEIVEMEEPDKCCGFAGSFSVDNPEISGALLADKLAAIEKTGAEIVALDCPGCLLQIRGGCRSRGLDKRIAHTAEILEDAISQKA